MYDINNDLIDGSSEWVKLDDISDYLIDATISIEDQYKNFTRSINDITTIS